MERKVFFSVIVPIYNAEKYLSECIESILNQTFQNFELLLIDDGSTDSSSDICKKYAKKDSRVKYLRKENEGVFLARLYGIKNVEGKYFTFCDADDYYLNKKVFVNLYNILIKKDYSFVQFGLIKKYNHLKQKICLDSNIECDEQNFYEKEYPKLLCSFWDDSHLTNSTCNKIYNSNLTTNLNDLSIKNSIFWGDDEILNIILLSNCTNVLFIKEPYYVYRQFTGNTYSFRKGTMNDLNTIKDYQIKYLNRSRYLNTEKYDKILSICYSEIAGWFFYFIHQAIDNMKEEEVKNLIIGTLKLPNFIKARDYYLKNKDNTILAINLLRDGDADKYINAVCNEKYNYDFKNRIRDILKSIYRKI